MISQDRLKELLSYDPISGIFIRLKSRSANRIGKQAGRLNTKGHRQIFVDGRRYLAHRLAWLYMTGLWPEDQIDHRDLVKDNNAFLNLREAHNYQNISNTLPSSANTSGIKGVSYYKSSGKWLARIGYMNKRIHLGYFDKIEDAAEAYRFAANTYHQEFARAA